MLFLTSATSGLLSHHLRTILLGHSKFVGSRSQTVRPVHFRDIHSHPAETVVPIAQWHTLPSEMSVLRQIVSRVSRIAPQLHTATLFETRLDNPRRNQANAAATQDLTWKVLEDQGYEVNPCGSWHHPAVKAGLRPADSEKSLQEAYTPASSCFGCGPEAGAHGLHLRSFRSQEGLEARMEFSEKYNCFPNVVNGGAISTALDCHGNWCAAVTLMDEACLPWPPLTVTYNINLTYREPTPTNTPLLLVAKTTKVSRETDLQAKLKIAVEVDLALYRELPGGDRELLVNGTGIYKRLGAIKAFA